MTLEKRPEELRLSSCLLNRGGNSLLFALVNTAPFVTARAIGADPHLLRNRLALDDEHSPAMHEKVVNLAHGRRTIRSRLFRVFKSKIINHVYFAILAEGAMQVVGHLPFGFGTSFLAMIAM